MYDSLSTLYHCMVPRQAEIAERLERYRDAQKIWRESLAQGDTLDLEDAANLRESACGLFSFAVGLRLGLSLSSDLDALTPLEF